MRIIRVGPRHGGPRLVVQGPGAAHVIHEFDDVMACAIQQSEIERQLVAKRYKLHKFSDRRTADRRQTPALPTSPTTTSPTVPTAPTAS